MALADLQWSYRGLVFGAGTDIYVNRAEGFEGFEARTSDADLPNGDGAIRGLDYVAPRTVAFELAVIELLGGTGYEDYWQQIRATFAPSRETDDELRFKRPGQPERVIRCRPIQLTRSEEYKRFNALGFPPVVLRAADPRIYAADAQTLTVPVYAAAAPGNELPADLPFDFASATRLELVAMNNGTAPAYPVVRFYAPEAQPEPVYYPGEDIFPSEDLFPNEPAYPGATMSAGGLAAGSIDAVKLTNTTTGEVLQIDTGVVGGQVLIADMAAAATGQPRLIVSVDDASRYGDWALPRAPFALAPGANSLRFEVTGTSTTARCQLTWSDTWLD